MTQISYALVGDYLLPNISLHKIPTETTPPLGRFARMHREYLRENKPILYSELLLSEKLYPLLREIDESANNRLALSSESNKSLIIQGIIKDLVFT